MHDRALTWRTLTITVLFAACADAAVEPTDSSAPLCVDQADAGHPSAPLFDDAAMEPGDSSAPPQEDAAAEPGDSGAVMRMDAAPAQHDRTALRLRDGTEIVPQSLRCFYRQDTGASHDLSLQLQYRADLDHVAFAAYLTNPRPASPFVASPRDVARFDFEAFLGGESGYQATLESHEVIVHLDSLPDPSSLRFGDIVPLHGQFEVTAFSLPGTWPAEPGSTLDLAAGSVAIDCEAEFEEVQVAN